MVRGLNRIFKSFVVACCVCGAGTYALAANELAQSFTLDGQLLLAGTTTVLSDSAAVLKIDILDPSKTCVLYEEQQTVNTVSSDGYFSVQVGSITGASKRTSSDPGLTMVQVFQNTSAVAATSASGSTCSGNTYTPSADAVRYFRITVTPSSTNVADVLSPDTTIDAAPMAMVAQSLQGYQATDFLAKAGLPTCSSGTFLSYDGTTLSCAGVSGSNGGTVTSVTAGTGLTGGTITASGTIALATSGATAGTYGSASAVPVVTVDTYGRVTNITTASISSAPSGAASGDLSGTYPSPTVSGLSGTALSISSLTSGQYLKYNGTNWINSTLSVSDSNITYGSEAANTFFAAPNGSAGAPTFRAMVAADLPTVPYTRGGTGLTATPANGQIAIGNGAGYTLGTLTAGTGVSITNAAGSVTIAATGGTGTVTSVTGTAPVSIATGTSTPVVSISQATTSSDGYLSSADWNTFNSKMGSSLASGDIFVGNASGGAVPVALSGDATLSNTGALTLATVATAGTYEKVIVNAKGLVTSGSSLGSSDITTALGYTPVNKAGDSMSGNLTFASGVGTVYTAANANTVTMEAPASVTTSYVLKLPAAVASSAGQVLTSDTSGNLSWTTPATGSVTSVGLSLPSIFTVTNSPVTSTGTLTATLASETANTFLAAPNGSAGTPTFRAIASADLPTIPVSGGGTGLTAGTSGGIPYYASTSTMASSALLTQYGVVYGGGAAAAPATTAVGTTGYVLTSNGGTSAPSFQQVSLSAGVTGTLPIANGGTSATTASAARTALGTAASGANGDITSTSVLTSISSSTSAISIAPTGNLNLSPSTAVVSSAVIETPLGTAAAPSHTNSTNPNTGMYFPTSTSLGFSTNGSNAMTVLSSGNVGVATTNPLTPLHVNGTSIAAPNAVVRITQTGGSVANGPYALVIGDDSQDATNYRGLRVALDSSGNAGFEDFINGSFKNIYFAPDGGNVGIGTDAPSYILDINGGTIHTTGAAAFENYSSSVSGSTFSFWKSRNYGADLSGDELGYISFYGDDGTGLHRSSYILSTVTAAPVSATHTVQGDLEFYTTSSGANDSTEKMVITSAGNVGIGSTSPVTKLSIVPTVYTTQTDGIEFISSDNSVNAIVQPIKIANANMNLFLGANMYANTAGGTPLFSTTAAGAGIDIRSDSGSIQFYSGTTGNAPTVNMVMNSSGYLGIGTGSPSYTLHVVGTAGLSSGTAWTNASDIRLKDIQGDYTHGLDEVLKLHTVKYNYKKGNALGLPSDFTKTGFIAQEVQKVIPEAVSTRKDGYLELNVDPIHWAVVNAVKDLYNKYIVKMLETEKKQDRDIASLKASAEQEKSRQDLEIEKLKKENAEKTKELADLKARMDRLEKSLAK